jgi:hypothetical protein
LTGTTTFSYLLYPAIFFNAETTNKWKVTIADTGFPGKAKISLGVLLPCGIVAKVVGLLYIYIYIYIYKSV